MLDNDKLLDVYKYNILQPDEELVNKIISIDNELSRSQAKIIANRYRDETLLEDVVLPDINLGEVIYGLPGIENAAEIIAEHIKKGSYILLVTDFDSDGVNSAAVLHHVFKNVFRYPLDKFDVIVNRRRDGTGFNKVLVNKILDIDKEKKVGLVITADHASSDKKALLKFKNVGIDVVVTDHHQIPDDSIITAVDGFVNPMREGTKEVINNISGCFVAFAVMLATNKVLTGKHRIKRFLFVMPFVAISTITDMMSMYKPINRYIVKRGLVELNSLRDLRWLIIKKTLKIVGLVNYKNIAYSIGPMINTGNRVDQESVPFNLLIADNAKDMKIYANELNSLHKLRKSVQKGVLVEAEKQADNYEYEDSVVIGIDSKYSINGIISANIQGDTDKPTMCFINNDNENNNVITGSCRADDSVHNVVEIFKYIEKNYDGVMVKYGGHAGAGGCSIKSDKIDEFKKGFNEAVTSITKGIRKDKIYNIDIVLPDYKLTPHIARALENVGGYGKDWAPPILLSEFTIGRIHKINDKFVRITFLTRTRREITVMYFTKSKNVINGSNIDLLLKRNTKVYVVYNLFLDSYNGVMDYSMNILDIRVKE